jgi:hypothetical protein
MSPRNIYSAVVTSVAKRESPPPVNRQSPFQRIYYSVMLILKTTYLLLTQIQRPFYRNGIFTKLFRGRVKLFWISSLLLPASVYAQCSITGLWGAILLNVLSVNELGLRSLLFRYYRYQNIFIC